MKSLIEALNHPGEAYQKGSRAISWGLVIITVLINSIFEPVLQRFCGVSTPNIDVLKMMRITGFGVLSYIIICFTFWAVCKCFGSKATFADHINAWGISYAPTAVCAFVVALTEVFFFVFWNNKIWGMLLNIVFIGVLIWKAILYFIYLKELAKLKGWRFFSVCAIMGIIILAMAALNGYAGLKTPVL